MVEEVVVGVVAEVLPEFVKWQLLLPMLLMMVLYPP